MRQISNLLFRQVPAARWFAILAICFFAWCIARWGSNHEFFQEPARVTQSDRALVYSLIDSGWLSAVPALEPVQDIGAYSAPSPWGAGAATLYVGRQSGRLWPHPETEALFREFMLIHELVHIEHMATPLRASDPELRPFSELLHATPQSFWAQSFDEALADWQACIILLRRHGTGILPFLSDIHAWRQSQGLFAEIDPHLQFDLLGAWLDRANEQERALYQGIKVAALRQVLFDQSLLVAVDWLSRHPDDQSDLFMGTHKRFLIDAPLTPEGWQDWEQAAFDHARHRMDALPRPPTDGRPSRRWRWLQSMASTPPPAWWEQVAAQADRAWQQDIRAHAAIAMSRLDQAP